MAALQSVTRNCSEAKKVKQITVLKVFDKFLKHLHDMETDLDAAEIADGDVVVDAGPLQHIYPDLTAVFADSSFFTGSTPVKSMSSILFLW